jgi:aldose 1-epimerase
VDAIEPVTLTVASDEVEAVLLPERGARLHRLRVFGHDLLRTPPSVDEYEREPFFWGGFVMAPWCNRIEARPTLVGGRTVDLPSNFADGTAIHGQVYDRAWTVAPDGSLSIAGGGDAWPWHYAVTLRVTVDGPRLHLAYALTNESEAPMPAGIGIHPWFRRPLDVAFPADRVFVSNQDSRPEPEPVGGPHDLRRLQPMPTGLDATWVRREEPVTLRWPEIEVTASLQAGPRAGFLCAASPDGIDAVAIEPQTQAPNGLRRLLRDEPGRLEWLAPGETLPLEVQLLFAH